MATWGEIAQKRLQRRFHRLLASCKAQAEVLGSLEPYIYFESESGLVVLDGPPHDDAGRPRHTSVLFKLKWPDGITTDVGSW